VYPAHHVPEGMRLFVLASLELSMCILVCQPPESSWRIRTFSAGHRVDGARQARAVRHDEVAQRGLRERRERDVLLHHPLRGPTPGL
jgi:hypothetical protein